MAAQEIVSSFAYYIAEETSLYGFIQQSSPAEEDSVENKFSTFDLGAAKSGTGGVSENGTFTPLIGESPEGRPMGASDESLEDIDSEEGFQLFLLNNLQQIAGRAASSVYFDFRMGLLLNDTHINRYFIKNGMNGISYAGSHVLSDDLVIIKLNYYFVIPIFQNLLPPVEVVQSITMRSFTGHHVPLKNAEEADEDEEDIVYIAETGQVYHTDKNCTYIKLLINEASFSDISTLRSKSGGIYHECSICKGKGMKNNKVYVTDYGDRYHTTLSCSGIKRTVISKKLSEVSDRRLCSKCVKKI